MNRVRIPFLVGCFAMLVSLAGCGGSPGMTPEDWDPTDEDNVRQVVSSVSGARSRPERMTELFVEVPDNDWLSASNGKFFQLVEVAVDGDEAVATMSIEDRDGNEISQQSWKCVRDGESWKVAEAPLGQ